MLQEANLLYLAHAIAASNHNGSSTQLLTDSSRSFLDYHLFSKKTQKGLVRLIRMNKVPPPTARLVGSKRSLNQQQYREIIGCSSGKKRLRVIKTPSSCRFVPITLFKTNPQTRRKSCRPLISSFAKDATFQSRSRNRLLSSTALSAAGFASR